KTACHIFRVLPGDGPGPRGGRHRAWGLIFFLAKSADNRISKLRLPRYFGSWPRSWRANKYGETVMGEPQVGWLLAIVVGAVAGWIAEMIMKSNQGLLMNIVLGIVGAIIANVLFAMIGISFGGVIGYLVAGVVGACLLIALARMLRGGPRAI
ncbi:GlsB/YeaQ/YmgE family stress response membrane protein, partial [Asticcacaulis biprosthecium]|uniref:GlsB/YeaQ/YmgE family stress response membrane protein n=1 Tax=Asticcacaulis biprosthecium TaxID=76891 RepID=UPI001FE1F4FC